MTYISLLVALLVLSLLTYILLKSKARNEKRKFDPNKLDTPNTNQTDGLNTNLVQSKWAEITAMQSAGPSGLKNALSEADKLLDYVMMQKGFTGDTMADRLKSGGSAFGNLNAIWAAHKLRNQMAHEVEHDMVADQVKRSIADLGQGIRDLGVSI